MEPAVMTKEVWTALVELKAVVGELVLVWSSWKELSCSSWLVTLRSRVRLVLRLFLNLRSRWKLRESVWNSSWSFAKR
jgi:uncharacterized membrane protein YjdF